MTADQPPTPPTLAERAAALQAYEVVDHTFGGLLPVVRYGRPPRPTLARTRYYLAGVNDAQRDIYNAHCAERYAERSPHHYSSCDDVVARAELAGDIWSARAVYEVSDAFVAFDGLVLQDGPPARLFAHERLPGFSGLGRLLLALAGLQLLRITMDQRRVFVRPADLTLARFSARHTERVSELPEGRGIENVHAYTYARTFANASGGGDDGVDDDGDDDGQCALDEDEERRRKREAEEAAAVAGGAVVRHSACLLVVEQFWTANYWHWLTDALPKALVFREMREQGLLPKDSNCKLLSYSLGWNRQYLQLAGFARSQLLPYRRDTLEHACRVFVASASPLDASSVLSLRRLRSVVLPAAAAAAAAAASAAGAAADDARGLVLVQVRGTSGDSVHGAGRTLTNLGELMVLLRRAFGDDDGGGGGGGGGGGQGGGGIGGRRAEVRLFEHGGLSVAQQVQMHARADVIIGVHGAGLANALWARKGCQLVEIVPVDVHLDFQCGLTPFWYVAELLGLRKHAFIDYDGRMFEPSKLPLVEFAAFLRAAGVVARGGGLASLAEEGVGEAEPEG